MDKEQNECCRNQGEENKGSLGKPACSEQQAAVASRAWSKEQPETHSWENNQLVDRSSDKVFFSDIVIGVYGYNYHCQQTEQLKKSLFWENTGC